MRSIDFKHDESFMAEWPTHIPLPREITLVQESWDFVGSHTPVGFFDEKELDYGDGPKICLTMGNGATFTLTEIDPSDCNPEEVEWSGDWGSYLPLVDTYGDNILLSFDGLPASQKKDLYAIYDALGELFDHVAVRTLVSSVDEE